jgi:GT2 family glycosyltransferase/glycosyltransferase involved in cell wall biosynthesis
VRDWQSRPDGASGAHTFRQHLAVDAWQRGQAACLAGDGELARIWLERASRLAPEDKTISLALASVCLSRDDRRAAALFESVTARHDVREAWFGLAAALRNVGDATGAATALAQALGRHVPPTDAALSTLADAIGTAVWAPGWCGCSLDGVVTVRCRRPDREPEFWVDGARIRPRRSGGALRLARDAANGRLLRITVDGRDLIGSPILLRAIRRTEGVVSTRAGDIHGWAWHPADPDTDPILTIRAAGCDQVRLSITVSDIGVDVASGLVLGRPRGFRIPAERLVGLRGLLRVTGRDGRDLLGSPLDPSLEQRASVQAVAAMACAGPRSVRRNPNSLANWGADRGRDPPLVSLPADIVGPNPPVGFPGGFARSLRRRPIAVVVPVYAGLATTLACLETVLATIERDTRVIIIDDGSPDPELSAALGRFATNKRASLIRHQQNRGFPASANAGLKLAAGHDVVLLNSDTLVPPGWLERLRAAAYAAANIGTANPLSNDATILSYPDSGGGNSVPSRAEAIKIDRLTRAANGNDVIDIPTAVGFCMYIRRDCLDATGMLREDVFAQGYGEENDFCIRARHLGWRHVAATGLFVAHVGGQSFGAAAKHLLARNMAVLNRLHPGYDELIAAHVAADPLRAARRRIDLARWRRARGASARRAVVFITHDSGGGVERVVAERAAAAQRRNQRAIVLRPARAPNLEAPERRFQGVLVSDGVERAYPNLLFSLPAELTILYRLLRGEAPVVIEVHHLLGHHQAVLELGRLLDVPHEVHVHDYAWFCPQITLFDANRRYCGEPEMTVCDRCLADNGSMLEEDITVANLRQRSADLFARAARVVVPSADTAARLRRHFPGISPTILPHEDDQALIFTPRYPSQIRTRRRVCVIGGIGLEKGYEVLLAAARDAAGRNLPLEFVVVGHTMDDKRLLDTGRVFVTGPYQQTEAITVIENQDADLAFLPSIWPETWCFTLTEAWRAGLYVAVFDIGALAERVRATGRGLVLPIGINTATLNNALLAAARQASQEYVLEESAAS